MNLRRKTKVIMSVMIALIATSAMYSNVAANDLIGVPQVNITTPITATVNNVGHIGRYCLSTPYNIYVRFEIGTSIPVPMRVKLYQFNSRYETEPRLVNEYVLTREENSFVYFPPDYYAYYVSVQPDDYNMVGFNYTMKLNFSSDGKSWFGF